MAAPVVVDSRSRLEVGDQVDSLAFPASIEGVEIAFDEAQVHGGEL